MNALSTSTATITAWSEVRRLLRPWPQRIAVIAVSMLLFEALAVIPTLLMQRIVDQHLTPGLPDGILPLGPALPGGDGDWPRR